MTDEKNNGGQGIDGVLEELKRSYSEDSEANSLPLETEAASEEVSRDELQERLRSRFLNGDDRDDTPAQSYEYEIDEDFLQDAYNEKENIQDDIEEDYDEYIEGSGEDNEKTPLEEADAEEYEDDKEAPYFQGVEEIQEENSYEEYQEDEEIQLREGLEEVQEEEYNEALEAYDETQEDKEIQESDNQSVQINEDEPYLEDDEDYSLWYESEENYKPLELEDDEPEFVADELDGAFASEESVAYEETNGKGVAVKTAEDNYVDLFYTSGEYDRYKNMSFKERITEDTPTVEELETALNGACAEEEFTLEEFDEAETIPLVLEEDPLPTASEEEPSEPRGLDEADLALLLEFGYKDEVLQNVSSEEIERISDERVMDEILEQTEADESAEESEPSLDAAEDEEERFKIMREKLQRQYESYRRKRGGVFLRLIISSLIACVLLIYEALPIMGIEFGGILNRRDYFFVYALLGMQLMIFAAVPAFTRMYESCKKLLSFGIDVYFLASVSVIITFVYDLIVVFASSSIPPTFHFCAVMAVILAELSELMHIVTDMRNYEYYFSEYLLEDDGNDAEKKKYTLLKSEGRGSVAEKMYAGGLDSKNTVYFPRDIESTIGFFFASKRESKRGKRMLSTVVISAIVALMLTIVSGIIYEDLWIASAAFMITFNLMLPIVVTVAEWLPFERLSAQNYNYGAAFASEVSAEQYGDCDMLVFKDMHLFEKCESRNVNLAIYDSTSKAVLLSCLNSLYSEIGGPLESAFASLKLSPLGKCKINRIARSGVEALVGSSYSILVGDEQFMSRYGIFFPAAALGKEEDKIYTLCVSINNRPTARIAVKYKINERFYELLQKLADDKIYCVIETYDPMISTELFVRVRTYKGAPVNIVHRNAAEHALDKQNKKETALVSAMSDELSLLARGSRLNLAAAVSNAKKMRLLRTLLNVTSGVLIAMGALLSVILVLTESIASFNEMFVLLYWLVGFLALAGLMIWKFPQKDRFLFNKRKKP